MKLGKSAYRKGEKAQNLIVKNFYPSFKKGSIDDIFYAVVG